MSDPLSRNPFKGMRRYPDQGWIGGVCAGIAVHFDWSVKLVRIVAALLLVFSGFWPTGVLYLVLWYVLDPIRTDDAATNPAPAAGPVPTPGAGASAPPADMGTLKARFARLEARLRAVESCVVSEEFQLRREFHKLQS